MEQTENASIVARVGEEQQAETNRIRIEIKRRLVAQGVQEDSLDTEYERIMTEAARGKFCGAVWQKCTAWECRLYGCLARE